jgi:outer membrane murein-binding lipoprotein Lpp
MPSQLKPLSRSQLYWAFLSYQNHLDKLAADDQAKGKDGSWLRNDLQKRLGFSDQDYAPIRTSAQRLTSKVQVLAEKAKQIRAAGSSSGSTQAQALSGLTKQRHEYIGNEINSLIQALSPQNKAALEAFMTQFFSPKNLTFSAPPSVGQSAGTAVQK